MPTGPRGHDIAAVATRTAPPAPAPPSRGRADLDRLLDAERRLSRALEAARTEADALRAEGARRAAQIDAEVTARLDALLAELERAIAAERDRRAAALAEAGRARAAAFDAAPADRIARAARAVLDALVTGADP